MDAKRINVLLIEDDEDDALLVQEILSNVKGKPVFNLERVERLSAGLDRLAKGGIDVIVSDLNLPDSQELETFFKVYAAAPEIPIVITSSFSSESLAISAVSKGAQDYLCKEYLTDFLLIRSLLYALERNQINKKLQKERHSLEDLVKEESKEILEIHNKLIKAEWLVIAGLIASEAAHELRNPLTVINFGIYYLKETLSKSQVNSNETLIQINRMEKAIERANSFINDLLYSVRPRILNLKSININDVIASSLNELPGDVLTGVEVIKELTPDLPLIDADPERLKQVFVNLIKNAVESMTETKTKQLTLRSEAREHLVKVSITDTGKGIMAKDLSHVFEPFFTTKNKGIGLGMIICRNIIESHQGGINLTSKVGKGTTVEVTLNRGKKHR